MVYVGLDMSLTGTGVAIKDGNNVTVHTVKSQPKNFKNDLDRLNHIITTVYSLVPQGAFICIEDVFTPQGKHQIGAAMKLIGLAYLIRKHIYEKGHTFFIVSPSQVKKFVSGNGNCAKDQITKEVYKRWSIDTKDDNQADACCLAFLAEALDTYIKDESSVSNLNKAQAEVIRTVTLERPSYNIELKKAAVVNDDE